MARLAMIVGSFVTILCAWSSMAQVVSCPIKGGDQFLFIEWNLRQNATMNAQEISNILGAPLAQLLSQTPGFVQLMSMPVNDTTVRIITLFQNTQQLNAARNTISMFVLNNLISQIVLVRSLAGTVQSDVLNLQICIQNQLVNTGRFMAVRLMAVQPGASLAAVDVVSQTVTLSNELQLLPGFVEFMTLVVEDAVTSQVILVSIFETQSQAVDASIRQEQFTSAGTLAGQLQLVEADVSPIVFDQIIF